MFVYRVDADCMFYCSTFVNRVKIISNIPISRWYTYYSSEHNFVTCCHSVYSSEKFSSFFVHLSIVCFFADFFVWIVETNVSITVYFFITQVRPFYGDHSMKISYTISLRIVVWNSISDFAKTSWDSIKISTQHPWNVQRASPKYPLVIFRISTGYPQNIRRKFSKYSSDILAYPYDILKLSIEHPQDMNRPFTGYPWCILRISVE